LGRALPLEKRRVRIKIAEPRTSRSGPSKPLGVGVELLPLEAVDDEVCGVTAPEAAPRCSPPLLAELMQGSKLPRQQGDLVVGDALVLLIRSCSQKGQDKHQS
jgi:hypothetical protein